MHASIVRLMFPARVAVPVPAIAQARCISVAFEAPMTTPDDSDDRNDRNPSDSLDVDPATLAPDDDPANNPHDTFVKRVFTSPEAAGVELRMLLPAVLVEQLVWSSLRVVPISFVDPSLAERESDILYAIDLAATGRSVFVYVLLEHQSTLDRMMAWRSGSVGRRTSPARSPPCRSSYRS